MPPPELLDELEDDELDELDELEDDELDELEDDELDELLADLLADLLDELDGPGRWELAQLLGDGCGRQHGEQLIS